MKTWKCDCRSVRYFTGAKIIYIKIALNVALEYDELHGNPWQAGRLCLLVKIIIILKGEYTVKHIVERACRYSANSRTSELFSETTDGYSDVCYIIKKQLFIIQHSDKPNARTQSIVCR